jgi:predicted ribosome quality control (RQC) complex YloA/Tae2 family protein
MLSLLELRRAARLLQNNILGTSLRRIKQTDDEQAIVLVFEGQKKFNLFISCNPQFARICLTDSTDSSRAASSFREYLRAHLVGSLLMEIEPSSGDRQVRFHLQTPAGVFKLVFSILGVRSNIYLLDPAGNLAHSLRSLDDTRSELKVGAPWVDSSGALASEGIDRWEETPDELFLEALEKKYRRLEREHAVESLAHKIEQAIKKELRFLDRKYLNLQEDLGEAKKAEEHREKGELLKSVLHAIKPGDQVAKAMDYKTGAAIEIPLDPRLSPAANLESYFAHYQKESRGLEMIQQQVDTLEIARSEFIGIQQKLRETLNKNMPEIVALEEIANHPKIRKLIHRYSPKPKRMVGFAPAKSSAKKEIPSRLTPKRYRTQDGLEIWVGKNDEGNDHLTTRLARGNDLFFHLEGYPGSHVILRTEGRSDPPVSALLDACELAVHYSKMKNAGSADVHVAPVKDIKKPKGAKPGLVYVRKGKTIHLRRDSKRLESILASRFED